MSKAVLKDSTNTISSRMQTRSQRKCSNKRDKIATNVKKEAKNVQNDQTSSISKRKQHRSNKQNSAGTCKQTTFQLKVEKFSTINAEVLSDPCK